MSQFKVWENEYRNPKLISNSNEPQLDFKHFVKWMRKTKHVSLDGLRVLDLGSGTGKNSLFLAERGSITTGIELSKTAVKMATERAREKDLTANFFEGDIGVKFPFADNSFDLIIDVVSSNSLTEIERANYLQESHRVLVPGGLMYVKALCKDGDKHSQNLIEKFPGQEKNTYILPEIGITERVFEKVEVEKIYSQYFQINKIESKTSYTEVAGKSYKRHFWLLYLQKGML